MISVEDVTKSYGSLRAVDTISFQAHPGQVTGFLGPNGAGKTTTMRMMVGLTEPTAGRVLIGGRPYRQIPNPGREVGILIDASAQHPGRTGRDVLTLGAATMGLPRTRADELLAAVGLTPAEAKRRVRDYSLGMRQRLGLAHALLGDPSVLILDEPANGLDPAGIRWMRSLLRNYADRGGTVLLSSHLLHEVELIADRLVLIGGGRIVADGDRASLQAANRGSETTTVTAADPDRLAQAFDRAGVTHRRADGHLVVEAAAETVWRIAADAEVPLLSMGSADDSLEDLFLSLTTNHDRDPNPSHPIDPAAQGA
jgi:ABC-2 type transport system ATP-binding protein